MSPLGRKGRLERGRGLNNLAAPRPRTPRASAALLMISWWLPYFIRPVIINDDLPYFIGPVVTTP